MDIYLALLYNKHQKMSKGKRGCKQMEIIGNWQRRNIKKIIAAAMLILLLSGCTKNPPVREPEERESVEQESTERVATEQESTFPALAGKEEPEFPREENALQWKLKDFTHRFVKQYNTKTEEYPLMQDTEWEQSVICLRGEQDGPVIYFVCGLHGDERAGWMAGNLLKEVTLKTGTIYILSPANLYGAQNDQRKTKSGRDANRYFPGNPEGSDAEQIDDAIYRDILDKSPDLVLDLHEGLVHTDGTDNLGNSIICEDISLMSDLVWDIMVEAETGKLCNGLTLYGTPPEGSLNREVTKRLAIPVITVETCRSETLAQRVDKQLELAEFILTHEGLR